MHRNRFSRSKREILRTLRRINHKPISYDDLAALTGYDPDTVRVSVRALEQRRRIVTVRGRGGKANRYLLVEKVIALQETDPC